MLGFIEMKTEGYCGGAGAGQQVAVWESLCFVYLEHKRQQASKARSGRAAGRASVVYRLRYYDWERKRVKQLLRMGHQSPYLLHHIPELPLTAATAPTRYTCAPTSALVT